MTGKRISDMAMVVLALTVLWAASAVATVYYVDDGAAAGGDGSTWALAFNCLQDALEAAFSGDEVRIAAGVYTPDQGESQTPGERTATFALTSGVVVKGGYAGLSQANPDARDPGLYVTVLSGDLNGDDVTVEPANLLTETTRAENSYHVLTGFSAPPYTAPVLDGVTVSGGNANGDYSMQQTRGAGLFNYAQLEHLTLNACVFTNNSASGDGGAVYIYNWSRPTITDCDFVGNQAEGGGGALVVSWYSAAVIKGCAFSGNVVTGGSSCNGGALAISMDGWYDATEAVSTTVTDCTFVDNHSSYGGGAIYNGIHNWNYAGNKNLPPTRLVNCTFICNSAPNIGGAIYNMQSGPDIINCTFTCNSTYPGYGGAMLTYYGGESEKMIPTVANSIFWNNGDDEIVDGVSAGTAPTTVVTYSDVQGGWDGTGNIDADPLFADADGRLALGSPCLNAGDNAAIPADITTDLDGNPRIAGSAVDMGAYEYPIIFVTIDIKPGSYPNAINLGSYGLVPVAILSTPEFDATTVDADSVALAGAGVEVRGKSNKYMAHQEDVDGDTLVDLVLQVATQNLDPAAFQDGQAILTGTTIDGMQIQGQDDVTIVPVE